MNFKERYNLNITNREANEYKEIETKNEASSFEIFSRNNEVEKILRTTFIKEKNVILASKKNSDKNIILSYIKKFIGKAQTVEVVENLEDDINFTTASKIIVPEPTIAEIVKILELILCDYKSFIFSLNIKSYENIIESLKTLILLNFNNLSNQNVQHLVGSTQAIVIYIDINEYGNYFITNIGEVEYSNGKICLNTLYDKQKNENSVLDEYGDFADIELPTTKVETTIEEKESKQEEVDEIIPSDKEITEPLLEEENKEIEQETLEETTENIEEESKQEENIEQTVEEEPVKVNKYKQLKEKLKRKKSLEQ